ncbi:MAG TPA: KUP/HAK/KT family potassium transporter [Thermoanaerobaculia bacterium]|nr:KUP/HAK/KT family potassium transporter [Thermoanaerobaculia bacterium]
MNKAGAVSESHGDSVRSAPLLLLALSALGVVFGDLGTSPLYALQEAFHGARGVAPTRDNVLGIVSLFLWALILMVSVKYVAVLMRAGNRGEGGILALLALLTGEKSTPTRRGAVFVTLALIGTAMLYGDGIITPAVSVLSAVEGLQVATPALGPSVIPITVCILVLLFAVQPFGSGRVGVLFGPVLAVWFVVIAILGAVTLASNPAALAAVNPLYAVRFFARNGARGFFALGAVVLCLTGGEALYADMGHFGRTPIRVAWYYLALPSLFLSYLGQAAMLLRDPGAAARPFYSCVPQRFLYPMVVLATLATIVASQALISAVFSLTRQAAQLGLSPRVQIVQTSGSVIGQIYLPALNWVLMFATVAIVLAFRSSDRLAAAFGLAVSTTMAITTLLFAAVARLRWHWRWIAVIAVAGTFLIADIAFVVANAFKFLDGGWLPLLIGAFVYLLMSTWQAGRYMLAACTRERVLPLDAFLASLARNPPHRVRGTGVFLAADHEGVPIVLLHHLKHNQVLHETVVLLTITTEESPAVEEEERVHVETLTLGFHRVVGRYGFMEEPNAPHVLDRARGLGIPIDPDRTTYYLGRTTIVPPDRKRTSLPTRLRIRLFALMKRNDRSATLYFHIPPNRVVELGTRFEL